MPTKKELEDRLNENPADHTTLDVQPPRTEADKQRLIKEEEERQAKETAKQKGIKNGKRKA